MSMLFARLAALAETAVTSSGKSGWEIAAPYVASAVALTAAFISLGVARGNRAATKRQERTAYRMRQLGEVYEPLVMLRMTTRELRRSLPGSESDGSRWRLVNHIADVKSDRGMRAVAEAIIALNSQIEDLLLSKTALLEGERPPSLDKFMRHSRLLKVVWQVEGEAVPDVGLEDVPFPDEIDDEIEVGRQVVKDALAALTGE